MKKTLCAIWELDVLSVRRLEDLSLEAGGQSALCADFHPHITLGTYEDMEETLLAHYIRGFADQIAPFDVCFSGVGLLSPNCSVCLPDYSGGLKTHYHAFHQCFDGFADKWTRLENQLYTPHVSLYGEDGPLPPTVLDRLRAAFTPFSGEVTGLALSWVKDEGEYEILAEYALHG